MKTKEREAEIKLIILLVGLLIGLFIGSKLADLELKQQAVLYGHAEIVEEGFQWKESAE
jgi:hypothetical protein